MLKIKKIKKNKIKYMKIKSKNILKNKNIKNVNLQSSTSPQKITLALEVLKAFNLFKEFKTAKLKNSLLKKKRQLSRKKKLIFIKRTQTSNLLHKGKLLTTKNNTILIKLRNKIFRFKRNKILFKGKKLIASASYPKNLNFNTNNKDLDKMLPLRTKKDPKLTGSLKAISNSSGLNSSFISQSSKVDLNLKALSWKFKILNKRHYKILSRLKKVNFKLIKNFNFPVDGFFASQEKKILGFAGIASENLVKNINFLEGIRYINSLSLMISFISNSHINQGQPSYNSENNNKNFALCENRKSLDLLNQKELFVGSRLISVMEAEPVKTMSMLSFATKTKSLNSTEEGFVSDKNGSEGFNREINGTQLNTTLIENNLKLLAKAQKATLTPSSNLIKFPAAQKVVEAQFNRQQVETSLNSSKYNLSSLQNIKSKVALNSSDFSTESLSLIKNLDLAFSTSQSKAMQENLLNKIISYSQSGPFSKFSSVEVAKSAKTTSFLNLWSSLYFNKKAYIAASNIITEADASFNSELNAHPSETGVQVLSSHKKILSENSKAKVTNELPPQPKIRMADQNYITYPYKKRVKSPSFISTYFTWKSGNSVYAILKYSFERMSCLISKPFFYETPKKMIIQIFYYSIFWDGFRYRQRPVKNHLLKTSSPASPFNEGVSTHSLENQNSYWVSLPSAKVSQATKNTKGSSFSTSFSSSNDILQNETDFIAKIKSFKKVRVIQKKAENISKSLIEQRKQQIITNFLIKNKKKFDKLCLILSKLLNKKVVLELNRVKRPYLDVTILAQLFHKNTQEKKSKIIRLISSLFYTLSNKYDWASDSSRTMSANNKKMKLHQTHGSLKGFFIKVGGRLLSQKIIPRISSKTYNRGKLARGKVHFVNTSRINNKHKRGAYSITITTSSIAL